MANPLEWIAQVRQRDLQRPSSGVSYYSPAQPIRPTGSLATSGTANRILSGGAPQVPAYGGGTPSFQGAGPQLGQPTETQVPQQLLGPEGQPITGSAPLQGGSLIDQALAASKQYEAQAQPPPAAGWRGVLGTAVNNPVGKGIMGALNVLDMPRRAVVSTVQETVDAINGGDASFSDWAEQFNDPSFGFGDVVGSTGSIWADRLIGLAGDVLLDPMTYVGGSAVHAGAGRAARISAGSRAIAEGFGEDVSSQLARYGYSAMDNDMRAQLRRAGHVIEDQGWRFRLPGQKTGVMIPGTQGLDAAMGRLGAGVRAGTYKIPGMSRLRSWRTPEGLTAAYEKLITGRGSMSITEAGEVINRHEAHKIAANTVQARLKQEGFNLRSKYTAEDLTAMMKQAEIDGGTELNAFFESAEKMGQEYGLYFHGRKKYIPHLVTQDFVKWINGETPSARAFKSELSIGKEIEEVSPALMERKLIARDEPYTIMGQKFHVPNGTIDEWNSEFARLFPDQPFKMMDDNIDSIMARYILGYADDVGVVAGAKHLVNSKSGLTRGFNDEEALKEVIDEVATTRMNDAAANLLRTQLKGVQNAARQIRDDTFKGVSGIQGLLGVELRSAVDEITTLSEQHRNYLNDLLLREEELGQQIGPRGVQLPEATGTKPLVPQPTLGPAIGPPSSTGVVMTAPPEIRLPNGRVIREGGPASAWRPPAQRGSIEAAFDEAAAVINTKILGYDQEIARINKEMLDAQKVYSQVETATRGRRMADVENVRRVRDKWNAIVQTRAAAELDRNAIYAIKDRIAQKELKQSKILMVHDNPSMLSLMAGEKVHKQQPQVPGAEYTAEGNRIVGYHPVYAEGTRNPDMIRADYDARRKAVLGESSPETRDFDAEIQSQQAQVSRAETELAEQMEIHRPNLEEARTHLQGIRNEVEELKAQRNSLKGVGNTQARIDIDAQIKAIQEGRLKEAEDLYQQFAEPITRAKANMEFADKRLQTLRRRQEENALGSPAGGGAAPREWPEQEPLPFTPQQMGQMRAQAAKDNAVERQWMRTPEYRESLAIKEEVRRIQLERMNEQALLDVKMNSKYSPLAMDGNGNITIPPKARDPKAEAVMAQRDELAEKIKMAQESLDAETNRYSMVEWTRRPKEHYAKVRQYEKELDGLQDQFNKLNHEIAAYGYEKYRGTAMQAVLDEAIARQKRIAAIDKELRRRQRRLNQLERPVKAVRARKEAYAQKIAKQNDAIRKNAERAAIPQVPRSVRIREQLASIDRDEQEALRSARANLIGYRPDVEDTTVSVPTPVRVVPLSDDFLVEQRFQEMVGPAGTPPGKRGTLHPDDDALLRDSYAMLNDSEYYKIVEGTDDPIALQHARAVIKDIEARRGPGYTRAQLATEATLDEYANEVARIQRARMIYPKPEKDTAPYLAIHMSTRPPGGSMKLTDQAEKAVQFGNRGRDLGTELKVAGAINDRQLASYEHQLAQLEYYSRLYGGDYGDETRPLINPDDIDPKTGKPRVIPNIDPTTGLPMRGAPDPRTAAALEQAIHDVNRTTEFMTRYASFLAMGGEPSPDLGAYILAQGLRDEVRVLDDQIDSVEKLIGGGVTKKWAAYEAKIAKHQNVVDEQQAIISRIDREFEETGYLDARAKKKAQNKMGEAKRLMNELEEPDTGFMDQEIMAMLDFATKRVMDVDDAVSYLRDVRNLRERIDYPARRRAELEQYVPRIASDLQETKNAITRRRQALTKALNRGDETVTISGMAFPQKINLTVEEAQEMIDSGAYLKSTAQEVQKGIDAARRAGRSHVEISKYDRYSATMTVDELEDEIARLEATVESGAMTLEANRLKLSVLDGTANIERDQLATIIQRIHNPPQPDQLQQMRNELALMSASDSESHLRRAEFLQRQIDVIENPPTAEELAEYTRQWKRLDDAIKGFEDSVTTEYAGMKAVIDSGQEFFTQLVNGQRSPTRQDIQIMRDLLGAEAADVADQYIQNANRILSQYGTNMSREDLVEVFDSIRRVVGDDSLSEYITRNLFGGMSEGDIINADVYRGEIINAMIAAAKTKHSDEMRQFAEMFDHMGFQVFSGRTKSEVERDIKLLQDEIALNPSGAPTSRQDEKMQLLQKELVAPGSPFTRKTMLQAMGYNMSRQTLDTHRMKQFIISQFSRQGFDPVESLRDKLLTLRMRRSRVRTMIRGLGGATNEPKLANPDNFYRFMFGEAEPKVIAPAEDTKKAVAKSKAKKKAEAAAPPPEPVPEAAVPTPTEPVAEPVTSGKTYDELQAEMDAVIEDPNLTMEEKSARFNELMAQQQNLSPAEQVEPLPPSPTAPPEPTPPPAAAAPPAGAPPKKMAWTNVTTGGWETAEGYRIVPSPEGGYRLNGPAGEDLGGFTSPRQAKATADAHRFSGETIPPAVPEAAAAAPPPPPPPETPPAGAAAPPPEEPTPPSDIDKIEAFQRGEIPLSELEGLPPGVGERLEGAIAAEAEVPTGPARQESAREWLVQQQLNELNDIQMIRGEFNDAEQTLYDNLQAELAQLRQGRRADPITQRYGPEGVNSPEFLAEAEARNLSPKSYEELVRYEARRAGRPNEVIYDWESVLFKGGPRFDVARRMRRGAEGEFERRAAQISGSAAVRPSGPFTQGALPQQAEAAAAPFAALGRQQEKLQEMYGRTEMELEDLHSEAVRLASQAEQKELAASPEGIYGQEYQAGVDWLKAQDIRREGERVQEAAQSDINAMMVGQSEARLELHHAEQEYTHELLKADNELGHVRSQIVAAHNDVAHLDAAKEQLERAINASPQTAIELQNQLNDLRVVNRMRKELTGADEADMISIEAMIDAGLEATRRLRITEASEGVLAMRLRNFENGASIVAPQMARRVVDGWKELAKQHLTGEDAVYVADGLSRALHNATVSWKDENFWKQVEKYTAFFKTYATATPGFHVRNALSSMFMNAVAGVRLKHTARAMPAWREFRTNPKQFWREADEQTRMAFAMVFGSGAGGQFMERGLGTEVTMGGKAYRKLMNNKITEWNKRLGEWVEGPTRLAMAMDSVDRGMSLHAGTNRITNFHFNYNEVSGMDRAAKRMIPFWTFMSRNMPLQIMQMWLHPRAYLHYQSLVRNFSEEGDPLTPDYWLAQGAFTMDPNAAKKDSAWFLAPDLPHLRVSEPFVAASQGDWGKALLSDINPLIAAPLEAFGVRQKFYTGAPIEGYSQPEGAMAAFTPIFQMLGATETGGTSGETLVPESWQHILRTMVPTVGLAERLTSTTGTRAGRQGETILRAATGAPVYKLTPELRQQQAQRQYFAAKDKLEAMKDLARS